MKAQQALDRLRGIVEPDLENYQRNIILKHGSDYDVFVIYRVSAGPSGADVYRRHDHIARFSGAKSALSWCIADKYQQHHLAQQILGLDQHLQRLEDDIAVRSSLTERFRTAQAKNAAQAKLDTKKCNLRQIRQQLDKCVNLAKYWQIRGFNNETARSGRTPSHTKNR